MNRRIKITIAVFLYYIGLLPKRYENSVRLLITTKKFNKKYFLNKKLTWIKKGYWQLSPMPAVDELNSYYKSFYWESRGGNINTILIERDIQHYQTLKKILPNIFSKSALKILNIGAGHGGISHLFHASGHNIINIEPDNIQKYYEKNWNTYSSIDYCNGIFDFIYSSHSLEHVYDIDIFLKKIKKISNNGTHFFFEVPNCMRKNEPIIRPPHTYYFTPDFFNKISKNVILNETYSQNKIVYNEEGNVIRCIFKGLN